MEPNEEAVFKVLQEINVKDMDNRVTINEVYYRPDYQDYQIIVNTRYHCEIREKLFLDYAQHEHPDIKREIIFRLDNLMEFEDWEDGPDSGGGEPASDGMVIDDSEKYDI
ncbi:MAG: hypothetical protein KAR05_00190 [Candidatus Omnitrophica bacterium]|nr:hypothetical protein [Candidatus Omnitrophota bacterium]